jgi:hypothetical protein
LLEEEGHAGHYSIWPAEPSFRFRVIYLELVMKCFGRWRLPVPVWNRNQERGSGFVYDLSQSLALVEWRYPGLLEPVTDGLMVIASDYSGQHMRATHEAYSFLITTDSAVDEWHRIRQKFRRRWLPDGRRLSFKQLREPMRWRALGPFLKAAGTIRGNVLTFLVDRRIKSFSQGGTQALAGLFPDCFTPETPPGTIEKMFRHSSFIAMLTAGFRRQDQPSLWISDHDETLETFDRREQLCQRAPQNQPPWGASPAT